jgi:hypothetical protein
MITVSHRVKRISKEELQNVIFCNSVGYFTDSEVRESNRRLHLSILMAERTASDVKIVINTTDGYRELNAYIWGVTEKYILIRGCRFIPLESVASVSLASIL